MLSLFFLTKTMKKHDFVKRNQFIFTFVLDANYLPLWTTMEAIMLRKLFELMLMLVIGLEIYVFLLMF